MPSFARVVAATLVAVALLVPPARAQAQTQTPVDSRPIKKIALLQIEEQERIGARTIIQGGGAIWQLVFPDQTERVTAAFAPNPPLLGTALTDAVEAALRAAGYEVVRVRTAREDRHKFLKSYAGIRTDAQAILDMSSPGAGFFRPSNMLAFRPAMDVRAKLVATEGGRTIYQGYLKFDLQHEPDAPGYHQHKVEGIEELEADPPHAKASLVAIVPLLAAEVAKTVNEKNRPFDPVQAERETSSDPHASRGDDRTSN